MNATINSTSTSEPRILAPVTGALLLPPAPLTLVTDEDTLGTVAVGVHLIGDRPGALTFALTRLPAHGTAAVQQTGLVTYQPAADFNGSDRLVVTVTATFSDGAAPPLLLGTVPVLMTVRSRNDAPVLTPPGNQLSSEGAAVALNITVRDVEPDTLSFSASGLPPGLSLEPTTGRISGMLTATASAESPYTVTLTVSDGTSSARTIFTWTVIPVGLPPNTVRIGSPAGPVTSGATFTVPVQFNAEAAQVVSYLFELTFDPAVVLVVEVSQGSELFEMPITNPAAFASGAVRFAANNPTFAPATGVLTLANVTFQVIGTAGHTSPLQLRFPTSGVLVNRAFQAIAEVVFVDGVVQVQ